MLKRMAFSAAAFMCFASFALCSSPVGTWIGTYQFNPAKIKWPADAKQKMAAEATVNILKGAKFTFILKADKTFRMEIRTTQMGQSKMQVSEGKYSYSSNKVESITYKRDGKAVPVADQTKNTLLISPDGKTMKHTKVDPLVGGHLEFKRLNK